MAVVVERFLDPVSVDTDCVTAGVVVDRGVSLDDAVFIVVLLEEAAAAAFVEVDDGNDCATGAGDVILDVAGEDLTFLGTLILEDEVDAVFCTCRGVFGCRGLSDDDDDDDDSSGTDDLAPDFLCPDLLVDPVRFGDTCDPLAFNTDDFCCCCCCWDDGVVADGVVVVVVVVALVDDDSVAPTLSTLSLPFLVSVADAPVAGNDFRPPLFLPEFPFVLRFVLVSLSLPPFFSFPPVPSGIVVVLVSPARFVSFFSSLLAGTGSCIDFSSCFCAGVPVRAPVLRADVVVTAVLGAAAGAAPLLSPFLFEDCICLLGCVVYHSPPTLMGNGGVGVVVQRAAQTALLRRQRKSGGGCGCSSLCSSWGFRAGVRGLLRLSLCGEPHRWFGWLVFGFSRSFSGCSLVWCQTIRLSALRSSKCDPSRQKRMRAAEGYGEWRKGSWKWQWSRRGVRMKFLPKSKPMTTATVTITVTTTSTMTTMFSLG